MRIPNNCLVPANQVSTEISFLKKQTALGVFNPLLLEETIKCIEEWSCRASFAYGAVSARLGVVRHTRELALRSMALASGQMFVASNTLSSLIGQKPIEDQLTRGELKLLEDCRQMLVAAARKTQAKALG